jgi:hypothetical protein
MQRAEVGAEGKGRGARSAGARMEDVRVAYALERLEISIA